MYRFKTKQNHFKSFNLYIASVPFVNRVHQHHVFGFKWRPVISLGMHWHHGKRRVLVATITTQGEHKPDYIVSSFIYRIHNWSACGLRKPSFIDTHLYKWVNLNYIRGPIGRMPLRERAGWHNFVEAHRGAYNHTVLHFWSRFLKPKVFNLAGMRVNN